MKGEKNGCISDKKGAWKNMTKETDKISVIVPVYNVKNYLEDCVQSITHQTYPDLEILLIDDGSDDGSGEICDRLQMTDARIRVFHENIRVYPVQEIKD